MTMVLYWAGSLPTKLGSSIRTLAQSGGYRKAKEEFAKGRHLAPSMSQFLPSFGQLNMSMTSHLNQFTALTREKRCTQVVLEGQDGLLGL
jgi:hypothetical protein